MSCWSIGRVSVEPVREGTGDCGRAEAGPKLGGGRGRVLNSERALDKRGRDLGGWESEREKAKKWTYLCPSSCFRLTPGLHLPPHIIWGKSNEVICHLWVGTLHEAFPISPHRLPLTTNSPSSHHSGRCRRNGSVPVMSRWGARAGAGARTSNISRRRKSARWGVATGWGVATRLKAG